MRRNRPLPLAALVLPMALIGGCPGVSIELPGGGSITIPGSDTVVVEVFNDTDFEVDPRLRFDDDSNWLAAWFPAEELATGILDPGELARYNMGCDDLGVIFSDTAGQFLGWETVGQADTTRKLRRGKDYDCGDRIRFHFIGRFEDFGVIVTVNGAVVD